MRIGVPKEIHEGEMRVATTPEVAAQLQALGFEVSIERGAGAAASFDDDAYRRARAEIVDRASLWSGSDIILKVRAPEAGELGMLHSGQTIIAFLWPAQNPELLRQLANVA